MTSGANKKKTDHHGITAKKIIKMMIAQTMIPIFNIITFKFTYFTPSERMEGAVTQATGQIALTSLSAPFPFYKVKEYNLYCKEK